MATRGSISNLLSSEDTYRPLRVLPAFMQPLYTEYNKTQQLEAVLRTMHTQQEQQCKLRA
jgi:hypothetical protein